MKNERELFLYELEGHGYEFKNKTWIHGMGDVGGLFDDDQLNMVWEMWQASALRESYKLVPIEPTHEMINAGRIAKLETKGSLRQEYKAMIGACDE